MREQPQRVTQGIAGVSLMQIQVSVAPLHHSTSIYLDQSSLLKGRHLEPTKNPPVTFLHSLNSREVDVTSKRKE